MGQLILLFTNGGVIISNEWWAKGSGTNLSKINDGPTLSNQVVPSDIPGYGVDWDCHGDLTE